MIVVPNRSRAVPASGDEQTGRHRIHRGATCPDTGRIVGRTPAQFRAKAIIRRHGWDLTPRTRRAR